jgi:hypothetical protein
VARRADKHSVRDSLSESAHPSQLIRVSASELLLSAGQDGGAGDDGVGGSERRLGETTRRRAARPSARVLDPGSLKRRSLELRSAGDDGTRTETRTAAGIFYLIVGEMLGPFFALVSLLVGDNIVRTSVLGHAVLGVKPVDHILCLVSTEGPAAGPESRIPAVTTAYVRTGAP